MLGYYGETLLTFLYCYLVNLNLEALVTQVYSLQYSSRDFMNQIQY